MERILGTLLPPSPHQPPGGSFENRIQFLYLCWKCSCGFPLLLRIGSEGPRPCSFTNCPGPCPPHLLSLDTRPREPAPVASLLPLPPGGPPRPRRTRGFGGPPSHEGPPRACSAPPQRAGVRGPSSASPLPTASAFIGHDVQGYFRTTEMSTVDGWMKTVPYGHVRGCHSALKKKEILPYGTTR